MYLWLKVRLYCFVMARLWRYSHKLYNWCEDRRPAGGFHSCYIIKVRLMGPMKRYMAMKRLGYCPTKRDNKIIWKSSRRGEQANEYNN